MNKRFFCKLTAILAYMLAASAVLALPRITTQPTNQFASLGPNVTFFVFASGIAPLSYQWRFNEAEIAAATKRTLVLTNVQMINAGDYTVVATDTSGSVTSRVAHLDVDPAFTMITAGPVANDTGTSINGSWGDYNNDGFPDLLASNLDAPVDFLYLNKGDGTFERVLTNVIGGLLADGGGAWGDYDNDGFLDLYTVSGNNNGNWLYHNEGNGTLLKLTNAAVVGPIISDHYYAAGLAWVDYDNDGFLDMMVGNGIGVANFKNFLFHNEGNGTFSKVSAGNIVNDLRHTWAIAWG